MTAVLTYRTTELRNLAVNRHFFGITGGWRDGVEVRGKDFVLPGAAGQYELNRVDDHRVIHLEGFVLATDEANWDVEMAALEALFDPALGSGSLVVTTPYMGLAAPARAPSRRGSPTTWSPTWCRSWSAAGT